RWPDSGVEDKPDGTDTDGEKWEGRCRRSKRDTPRQSGRVPNFVDYCCRGRSPGLGQIEIRLTTPPAPPAIGSNEAKDGGNRQPQRIRLRRLHGNAAVGDFTAVPEVAFAVRRAYVRGQEQDGREAGRRNAEVRGNTGGGPEELC